MPAQRWHQHPLGTASDVHRMGLTLAVILATGQRFGHLTNKLLLPLGQTSKESRSLPIAFVEGQPVKANAVARGQVELLQSNLPLGTVDYLVRDAGLPTALPVVRPGFREEQVAAQQRSETSACNAEVDGDDTGIDLAQPAAPLALDTGSLGALLGLAGLIDNADGAQPLVVGKARQHLGRVFLGDVDHGGLVPDVIFEELLEAAWWGACGQGNGLSTFARQVGQQPPAIGAQMLERLRVGTAELKRLQVSIEVWSQLTHFLLGHGSS